MVAARSTRVPPPPPVPLRITIVFPSRCCSRACVDANGQAAPAAAELAFPRAHEDLSFPFRATRENSLFHSRTYSLLLEDSRQFRRHVYRRKKLIRTKYRPEKDAHNSYAEREKEGALSRKDPLQREDSGQQNLILALEGLRWRFDRSRCQQGCGNPPTSAVLHNCHPLRLEVAQ